MNRISDVTRDGFLRFETNTRNVGNGDFVLANATAFGHLFQVGDGDAARRFGEDAFALGQQLDALNDFFVGNGVNGATSFFGDALGIDTVRRIANRQRFGDGVRANRSDEILLLAERLSHRGTPIGLSARDFDRLAVDETQIHPLVEALVDFGEHGARRNRDNDMVGRLPAELLGDFVGEGLGTFRVERTQVHVDESPVIFVDALLVAVDSVGNLGAQSVHLIVVAFDGDDVGVIDERVHHFARFEVGGDEHVTVHTRASGMSRHRVGEVARRGTRGSGEPELDGAAECGGDDAIFEAPRRVGRVVLDVQIADSESAREIATFDKRCETGVQVDLWGTFDGQEILIAPHREGAARNFLARGLVGDGVVVVSDFEWAKTQFTNVFGRDFVFGAALFTFEAQKPRGAWLDGRVTVGNGMRRFQDSRLCQSVFLSSQYRLARAAQTKVPFPVPSAKVGTFELERK